MTQGAQKKLDDLAMILQGEDIFGEAFAKNHLEKSKTMPRKQKQGDQVE